MWMGSEAYDSILLKKAYSIITEIETSARLELT